MLTAALALSPVVRGSIAPRRGHLESVAAVGIKCDIYVNVSTSHSAFRVFSSTALPVCPDLSQHCLLFLLFQTDRVQFPTWTMLVPARLHTGVLFASTVALMQAPGLHRRRHPVTALGGSSPLLSSHPLLLSPCRPASQEQGFLLLFEIASLTLTPYKTNTCSF